MTTKLIIAFAFLVLFSSTASAGFYSSEYERAQGTVVATVPVKGKGIYNLVVTIEFVRKPQNNKVYKSEEYENYMNRLVVESRGIALKKILERKELAVSDFNELRNVIEKEIKNYAVQLRKYQLPGSNVDVVFSISNFYLLEPRVNK